MPEDTAFRFRSIGFASCLSLLALSVWVITAKEAPPKKPLGMHASYEAWNEACQRMLANRSHETFPDKNLLPITDPKPLYLMADSLVARGKVIKPWIGKNPPAPEASTFAPFAQKLSLAPGSRVVVHGDLHGDIRSLLASIADLQKRKILTGFKVTAPNTHLLFLGDYTDRGNYGVEVLYTLLRLRLENPRSVWLSRGNHEDPFMTERYGFAEEGIKKYGEDFEHRRITNLFEALPSVIYVGTRRDFLQSCHAGVEPGYSPRSLLANRSTLAYQRLGTLLRGKFRQAHGDLFDKAFHPDYREELEASLVDFTPTSPTKPYTLGFVWHDFTLYQKEPGLTMEPKLVERMTFGYGLTQGILKQHSTATTKVRGILRAHQHVSDLSPIMERLIASKGLFRHWQEAEIASELDPPPPMESQAVRPLVDGGVYTFNVSPDSSYGVDCDYTFNTYGILTLAPEFKDWRMEVVNLEVDVVR